MKLPRDWWDEGGSVLRKEQDAAIREGYKSVRVTKKTHEILQQLQEKHSSWPLDTIIRELVRRELANVHK